MRIRQNGCCARAARRFVDQQRQELPLRQPQRERARQPQQQPGFSSCPELNRRAIVESVVAVDQMPHPVLALFREPNCKATEVLVGGRMDVPLPKAPQPAEPVCPA